MVTRLLRKPADRFGRWLVDALGLPEWIPLSLHDETVQVASRVDAVERGMETVVERVERLERLFLCPDFPPEETKR